MFRKILVAMDISAIGKQVFDKALALAKATDACLMLLHVLSAEEEGSPNNYTFYSLDYYPVVSEQTALQNLLKLAHQAKAEALAG